MIDVKPRELAILVIGPFNEPFDYLFEDSFHKISTGQIVEVPFGRKQSVGIVVGEGSGKVPKEKLKKINKIFEVGRLSDECIEFINFLATWNCVFKGLVLKMILSPIEAITSPKTSKVYRLNFRYQRRNQNGNTLNLTPKKKLVTEFLLNSNSFSKGEKILQACNVSKALLRDMVRKNIIDEEFINELPTPYLNDVKKTKYENNKKLLNSHQISAVEKVNDSIRVKRSDCFLLDGVPGSGKTETYFECVQTCLDEGKQVLILLPEISLTPDWEKRFYDKFYFKPLVWHSNISKNKKKEIWLSAITGSKCVIVGARSALMLPFSHLGLIIVDEEHEPAFKQEETVRYNARDMAIYRATKSSAPIILASATPSLESYHNMKIGKYIHLNLPLRATGAEMPEINILDLKTDIPDKGRWISPSLLMEIKSNLLKKEQTLLFLNRRGYAPLTLCNACGHKIKCVNCETWLVEHKSRNLLICHHCGFSKKISNHCEFCKSEGQIKACGPGVERIEEEVKCFFPKAKLAVLSSDTMVSQNLLIDSIEKIKKNEIDIIIGTQMIAKGHDFPNLTLVGILDGDVGLSGGDLRAAERSFQILQQVTGRSGRHALNKKDRGKVFIQTFDSENEIIKAIAKNNRDDFFKRELNARKNAQMPPYGRLASIILSSKQEKDLGNYALELLKFSPSFKNVKIFGPAPSPLYYLRGKYRKRFLIKSDKEVNIQNVLLNWIAKVKIPNNIKLAIDIDPISFM